MGLGSRQQYLVSVNEHQVALLQLDGCFHGQDLQLLDGRTVEGPKKCLSAGEKKKSQSFFFLFHTSEHRFYD